MLNQIISSWCISLTSSRMTYFENASYGYALLSTQFLNLHWLQRRDRVRKHVYPFCHRLLLSMFSVSILILRFLLWTGVHCNYCCRRGESMGQNGTTSTTISIIVVAHVVPFFLSHTFHSLLQYFLSKTRLN